MLCRCARQDLAQTSWRSSPYGVRLSELNIKFNKSFLLRFLLISHLSVDMSLSLLLMGDTVSASPELGAVTMSRKSRSPSSLATTRRPGRILM